MSSILVFSLFSHLCSLPISLPPSVLLPLVYILLRTFFRLVPDTPLLPPLILPRVIYYGSQAQVC